MDIERFVFDLNTTETQEHHQWLAVKADAKLAMITAWQDYMDSKQDD